MPDITGEVSAELSGIFGTLYTAVKDVRKYYLATQEKKLQFRYYLNILDRFTHHRMCLVKLYITAHLVEHIMALEEETSPDKVIELMTCFKDYAANKIVESTAEMHGDVEPLVNAISYPTLDEVLRLADNFNRVYDPVDYDCGEDLRETIRFYFEHTTFDKECLHAFKKCVSQLVKKIIFNVSQQNIKTISLLDRVAMAPIASMNPETMSELYDAINQHYLNLNDEVGTGRKLTENVRLYRTKQNHTIIYYTMLYYTIKRFLMNVVKLKIYQTLTTKKDNNNFDLEFLRKKLKKVLMDLSKTKKITFETCLRLYNQNEQTSQMFKKRLKFFQYSELSRQVMQISKSVAESLDKKEAHDIKGNVFTTVETEVEKYTQDKISKLTMVKAGILGDTIKNEYFSNVDPIISLLLDNNFMFRKNVNFTILCILIKSLRLKFATREEAPDDERYSLLRLFNTLHYSDMCLFLVTRASPEDRLKLYFGKSMEIYVDRLINIAIERLQEMKTKHEKKREGHEKSRKKRKFALTEEDKAYLTRLLGLNTKYNIRI